MLTAGIVIGDSVSAGPLLAALQQTGLIGGVKQWLLATDRLPEGGEPIPDVLVLDLGRDPEPFFAFGTYVRRLKPSVRVIACSAVFPQTINCCWMLCEAVCKILFRNRWKLWH